MAKVSIINLSIFVIWLFHLTGVIGILYFDSKWFLSATPINLSISFILLLIVCWKTPKFLYILSLSFLIGFFSEYLGVNFGLIFGNYVYGSSLGIKFYDVPILIAANWSIVTICSASISNQFSKNIWVKIFIGIGMALILDLLIEPVAPVLDFWKFDNDVAPLQNYFGWFIVSLPLHFFYHYWKIEINSYFTHHLFILQLVFFMILLLKIKDLESAIG